MLSDPVAANIDEIAIVECLGIPSSRDNGVIGIAPGLLLPRAIILFSYAYGTREYSNRLGELRPGFPTTFGVAAPTIAFRTCSGVALWPSK